MRLPFIRAKTARALQTKLDEARAKLERRKEEISSLKSELKALRRKGRSSDSNVSHCTVCGQEVSVFNPLDQEYLNKFAAHHCGFRAYDFETLNIREYYCPKCQASDRDRLMAGWVEQQNFAEPLRTLDIAPAIGLGAFLKRHSASYRSADYMMPEADDKVDITSMPEYVDGRFNLVVCSHVLEHVDDDRKAMREVYRILSSGGTALMLVPILRPPHVFDEDTTVDDPAIRWQRFGQDDHVRLYSRASFSSRLQESGFIVEPIAAAEIFGDLRKNYGVLLSSVLYVCRKA